MTPIKITTILITSNTLFFIIVLLYEWWFELFRLPRIEKIISFV